MTRRPGATAIASNPVLVGVATTLVIVVAVFLAYNANQGLPWVPTYRLTAEVPSAANLVRGNEARIGGLACGRRRRDHAEEATRGLLRRARPEARDATSARCPVDSTIMIRPRSALGLKYVEITEGDSSEGFEDGATIPLRSYARSARSRSTSSMPCSTSHTRDGDQQNLRGSGCASPAAASDLNQALGAFEPLLRDVVAGAGQPVRPRTASARLLPARSARSPAERGAGGRGAGELLREPGHARSARCAESRGPSSRTRSRAVGRRSSGDRALPDQRPFLANSEFLFADLRPGTRRAAAPASRSRRRVRRRHEGARRSPRSTAASSRPPRAPGVREDPIVPHRLHGLIETVKALRSDDRRPHARPRRSATTSRSGSATWPACLATATRNGTWLRFIHSVADGAGRRTARVARPPARRRP